MKTLADYKEGEIKFYEACVRYMEHGNNLMDLEEIMLLAYSLSKYTREKHASGFSNPKLTGILQEIPVAIKRAIMLLDRTDVQPIVKANVLEVLSRSAYAELKKSRYH